jgi:hypothetical protein
MQLSYVQFFNVPSFLHLSRTQVNPKFFFCTISHICNNCTVHKQKIPIMILHELKHLFPIPYLCRNFKFPVDGIHISQAVITSCSQHNLYNSTATTAGIITTSILNATLNLSTPASVQCTALCFFTCHEPQCNALSRIH